MREKAKLRELTFGLTADVSEAHRQIPKAKCNWHSLKCQVQPGTSVHVNKVGTLDVPVFHTGTCSWPKTTTLKRAVRATGRHCWFSLSSAQRAGFHCTGTRRQRRYRGLGRVGTVAQEFPARCIAAPGRLVCQVDPRCFDRGVCQHEPTREGALAYEGTFLGPLHKVLTRIRIPAHGAFLMNHLSR